MNDTSKKALRRGHNEGNIRQRTDGRWEVRLSAGIDYRTGKPRRTSTCCNTRQEAISILQQAVVIILEGFLLKVVSKLVGDDIAAENGENYEVF